MSDFASIEGLSVERYFPPTSELPFGAFLLFLANGSSNIKTVYRHVKDDGYSYVLVNGIPILEWITSNNCPTCEMLLKSGNAEFDTTALSNIRSVTTLDLQQNPQSWYKVVLPILKLMQNGLYLVTYSEYFPTDGEGHLFWGEYESSKTAKSLNQGYWNIVDCKPSFLVASQSMNKFNPDRYKMAKTSYSMNPGIAFHLDGQLSLLLDGHHRALAAAEAGKSFGCFTVSRAMWSWKGGSTHRLPDTVEVAFGKTLETSVLSGLAQAWLLDNAKSNWIEDKQDWSFGVEAAIASKELNTIIESAKLKLDLFPGVEEVRIASETGEITSEKIEASFRSDSANPSLSDILTSLVCSKDNRAREVAIRILRDGSWHKHWAQALRFLSRFTDQEVLDLFVRFAVLEESKDKNIAKVIDNYMIANAQLYEG